MTLPLVPPAPLAPIAALRQFVLWGMNPEYDPPRKQPMDPRTGRIPHDAQDRSSWVGYAEAVTLVDAYAAARGVTFVVSDCDPFWFVDIDKCLGDDGQWSPLAQEVCQRFAGAYVEVSQSGRGLHLFGLGDCPPHGCKNEHLKLELYTEGRPAFLTGTGASGDAATDHTEALRWLVSTHLPPGGLGGARTAAAWLDRAVPEWSGPADDDELVAAMLSSRAGAAAALGKRASVHDLWAANAEVLASCYPPNDDSGASGWNYSVADAALAQHLAFWTGRNTERVRRLMYRTPMARAKWEEHRTYLWDTISGACAAQVEVYSRPSAEPPLSAPRGLVPRPEMTAGAQFLTQHQQSGFFAGCVYVRDLHEAFVPGGALLSSDRFKVVFGGYTFSMDASNERTTRSAWECFTESQAVRFPKVDTTCFRPELGVGEVVDLEGRRALNVYVPVETDSREGDAGPFLRHVEKLLPEEGDREILLAYLAAVAQHKGKKFRWWPVIQGAEGNGKTLLIKVAQHCVGRRYTHLPKASDLAGNGGKFNSWFIGKLFVGVEEISALERTDVLQVLKPMVTDEEVEVQAKGKDQVMGDNRANGLMCCNGKEDMAVGMDKRRYCVFYTAQQTEADIERDGMGGSYFPDLYRWLDEGGYAVVNHHLQSYKIPDRLNPAGTCVRAPKTSSTAEMYALSLSPVEQSVREAVEEQRPGFAGGYVLSSALTRLLADARQRLTPNRLRQTMQRLGYDLHPGLDEGRLQHQVPGETGRQRLYIRHGDAGREMRDAYNIVGAYCRAQGLTAPQLPAGASVTPIRN